MPIDAPQVGLGWHKQVGGVLLRSSALLFLAILLIGTSPRHPLPIAIAGDGHTQDYARTQPPALTSSPTSNIDFQTEDGPNRQYSTDNQSPSPQDTGAPNSIEATQIENAEFFEAAIQSYLSTLQESTKVDDDFFEDYDFQISISRWSAFLAKYKGFTKNIGRIIKENPEFIYFNAVITLIKYPAMAALTWSGYGALATVLLAIPDTVIANGFFYKIRKYLDSKHKKQNFGYSLSEFEELKRQLIQESNQHQVQHFLISHQGEEVLVPVSSKGLWTLTQRISGATHDPSARILLTESDLERVLARPELTSQIKSQISDPYLYQSILIQAIFQDEKKRNLLLKKADGVQNPKELQTLQRDLLTVQKVISLLNLKESTTPKKQTPGFFQRFSPSRVREWFQQKANYTVAKRSLRDLEYALVVEYFNQENSTTQQSENERPSLITRITTVLEKNGFSELASNLKSPCTAALKKP